MTHVLSRFILDETGQDLIEYAFLAVFVVLVVFAGIATVGTALNTGMSNIGTQVSSGS